MGSSRTIKYAINSETGSIVDADIIFNSSDRNSAFNFRKKYADTDILRCIVCNQPLDVASSARYNIHFRHKKNHDECALSSLSSVEYKSHCRHIASKESLRHKELKRLIYENLCKTESVSNIILDSKYIIDDLERYKPDVYCEYNTHKIAFEVQLSDISIKYIKRRANFYKRNNIYLIWVIDTDDKFKLLNKDLKYLYESKNLFLVSKYKLLKCKYLYAFISSDKVKTKWCYKDISLSDLTFNPSYEVCFYNTKDAKTKLNEQLLEELNIEDENIVTDLIAFIKRIISKDSNYNAEYGLAHTKISNLSSNQLVILNRQLNLNKIRNDGYTEFMKMIQEAKYTGFIDLILGHEELLINVNYEYCNTRFLSLFVNYEDKKCIQNHIISITKKARYFSSSELKTLVNRGLVDNYFWRMYFMKNSDLNEVEDLLNNDYIKVLKVIESIDRGEVVSFKFNNMVSLMNHAFEVFKPYWKYFETALRQCGFWDTLLSQDKKKTFLKKYESLSKEVFERDEQLEYLLDSIFHIRL